MTILPNGVAVIDGDTHHAAWCAEQGLIHDRWMADEICKHIKPGDVVIDGGANIGTLTRAMLDAGAIVMAFEPNPEAMECLRKNCPNATPFALALSDTNERVGVIKDENAGASFVVPDGDIQAVDLDLFMDAAGLESVALIKLDIEGYETKALRGARETIARCKPVLFVEVNRATLERAGSSEDELLSLIESLGYSWRILQWQCQRGSEQYDIECLPLQ